MTSETLYIDFDTERDKLSLWRFLQMLRGYWIVKVECVGKGRTAQQNRYYHSAYVRPLRDAINERQIENGRIERFTTDEVHIGLREKFLPMIQKVNPLTGRTYYEPQSTTKLSKQEFSNYLEAIARYAAEEFGLVIGTAN